MASLQKIQGKGKHAGKTFYRTQPVLPNGKRLTIRLGTGSKKAEASVKSISDLIDSINAGVEPSASTKSWIADTVDASLAGLLLANGLIAELPERLDETRKAMTIGSLADEFIRTRGAGQAETTITIYRKAKRNLVDCLGDVDITTIKTADAREFWRWLLEEGDQRSKPDALRGLASNTAKQRLRFARAFFEMAVEDELITKNPFKARGLTTSQTAAEKTYVPAATIENVIEHCPTLEWKLLFALIRAIPTRVPSEIRELTWADVDVEQNRILIHSPKTRKIGKSARLVPIFDSFKPLLDQAYFEADDHAVYVFPRLRTLSNLGKLAGDILTKAKIEIWPNFFNSLRATAETDLMDAYGLRRACQWAGNSPATAMKNYALIRKTDFIDTGSESAKDQKADAKCAAQSAARSPFDAQSAAESASTPEQQTPQNTKKAALKRTEEIPEVQLMGVEGLEPPTLSV